jgi:adenylyltransferase/sulfurtransferase
MNEDALKIEKDQIQVPDDEGRFARFNLISWWEQERLARAKVLVIGAGALGNELLKNLALLGVGEVVIADMDRIELSNLSRSVLYRAEDCGRLKADVAAERTMELYPEMKVHPLNVNVVYGLGLGVYRWADVILGGLDNREARVAMNRAAARCGKVWIDGAIERLDGVVRVFDPATGPCYECTMNATDWKMLEARRSCALLTRDEMEQGKVPTTPTTASVIAAIQCQEALKLLHDMETLAGGGYIFEGLYHQSHPIRYTQKPDCESHEADEPLVVLDDQCVSETRVGDFLRRVQSDLGENAVVELNHDVLVSLRCVDCDETEPIGTTLDLIGEGKGKCAKCGELRLPEITHTIDADSPYLDQTLAELGIPPWDVLSGRDGLEQIFYEFAGDREKVF